MRDEQIKARIVNLEEELACSYKQLRKSGLTPDEIKGYLFLAESELEDELELDNQGE